MMMHCQIGKPVYDRLIEEPVEEPIEEPIEKPINTATSGMAPEQSAACSTARLFTGNKSDYEAKTVDRSVYVCTRIFH